MAEPGIPGSTDDRLTLPCTRSVDADRLDMGMREFACPCGDRHAVVMDVHPLSRWIPESVADVLEESVEPTDEHDAFSTVHVMGMVLEEYPESTVVHDATRNPSFGWAMAWVTAFDARALHELVVELLIELMDHAVGHAEGADVRSRFDEQIDEFDIGAFVEEYRDIRDFGDASDRPG